MENTTKRKVIGYVSRSNPLTDCNAWSGTPYKIREALENAGYEVKWIKVPIHSFLFKIFKYARKISSRVMYWEYSYFYGWLCAKSIDIKVAKGCDILFFPFGFQMIKYLGNHSRQIPPIIYYSDSCFRLMVNYYWYNIPKYICHQANELEMAAIAKSDLVIKSSDWAMKSAIVDYSCPKEKAVVLEFGANIDDKNIKEAEYYSGGELRILFSGRDWKRKGGDNAVKITRILNEKGIKSRLFLLGIDARHLPQEFNNLDYVEYVGFLDKNIQQHYEKYMEVFSRCHIFLLPTKAECSATVLCEACAFGLPTFTYDTGGLANYVINGETGYRLDINTKAEDFADIIYLLIKNKQLDKLHRGAISLYKEKTSWSTWSKRITEVINNNVFY